MEAGDGDGGTFEGGVTGEILEGNGGKMGAEDEVGGEADGNGGDFADGGGGGDFARGSGGGDFAGGGGDCVFFFFGGGGGVFFLFGGGGDRGGGGGVPR